MAKYFFFTALDERVSFSASLKVLSELKANGWLDDEHRSRWIEVLAKWKPRLPGIGPRAWSEVPSDKGFTFPRGFDLSLWISFQSAADPIEVEAVLLSKVLGFSDQEIAAGLKTTVGTVRYRVGRGLRHLGAYIES
ncbi:MAG: hypothetical protein KF799_01595 [Bdellovibrionales bacterium]|nr:hypothetical protein [Bdellovibrionales bacterium]